MLTHSQPDPLGAPLPHVHAISRAADRSLLAVPASHVTGLVAITLPMFAVGGCVVALREFKARAFLELAARERMTHTLVVPAIYNLCLRDPDFERFDLSAWRIGGFGGASMPEGTIRGARGEAARPDPNERVRRDRDDLADDDHADGAAGGATSTASASWCRAATCA